VGIGRGRRITGSCADLPGAVTAAALDVGMLALIAVAVAACTIGCGEGGGQSTGPSTPATTAGSYIFTVTGTDSASANITASMNVTIVAKWERTIHSWIGVYNALPAIYSWAAGY
jgi:hypothetical protein